MPRTRAYRRAKQAREKQRARRWLETFTTWDEIPQRQIGRRAAARKACAGRCCGNPRRWIGLRSIQELRAFQEADDA